MAGIAATKSFLLDASKMGTMIDRKHRELDYETEIKYIADTYHKWKKGEGYEDIKGFCKSATLDGALP